MDDIVPWNFCQQVEYKPGTRKCGAHVFDLLQNGEKSRIDRLKIDFNVGVVTEFFDEPLSLNGLAADKRRDRGDDQNFYGF